jgi:hypothetical protein
MSTSERTTRSTRRRQVFGDIAGAAAAAAGPGTDASLIVTS